MGTAVDARPLAERLRPENLQDYIGQRHLLGDDAPLAIMARAHTLHSMILWGPPGTGKTTLARILAHNAGYHLTAISAVLAGVAQVREAVAQAKQRAQAGIATALFVDEVHRFNKAQQDAFLPHVEDGTVTFIGATTENPSFEVNGALLSRARVYVLQSLSGPELQDMAVRGARHLGRQLAAEAIENLEQAADGDARRLLNVLEIASQFATEGEVSAAHVDAATGEQLRRFDKGGDVFYEQISALHKSVRGSDPDAALYWFCRMLDGGADPRYLGRRLVRMASEDVGNADPRALELTLSAVQTYERLGSPEGELALAQAVLYLASVPKSDAAYQAFNQAMAYVRSTPSHPVPMHLRNAPTGMMKHMGYGAEYRHAHNERTELGAFAPGEHYFPEEVEPPSFYRPTDQGLESRIGARLARLAEMNRNAGQGLEEGYDDGAKGGGQDNRGGSDRV